MNFGTEILRQGYLLRQAEVAPAGPNKSRIEASEPVQTPDSGEPNI